MIFVGGNIPDLDCDSKLHRKVTHNIFFGIALAFIFWYIDPMFVVIVFGYLLHVVADMTTVKGVSILWPFSKKAYGGIGARPKTWEGDFMSAVLSFLFVFVLYSDYEFLLTL